VPRGKAAPPISAITSEQILMIVWGPLKLVYGTLSEIFYYCDNLLHDRILFYGRKKSIRPDPVVGLNGCRLIWTFRTLLGEPPIRFIRRFGCIERVTWISSRVIRTKRLRGVGWPDLKSFRKICFEILLG